MPVICASSETPLFYLPPPLSERAGQPQAPDVSGAHVRFKCGLLYALLKGCKASTVLTDGVALVASTVDASVDLIEVAFVVEHTVLRCKCFPFGDEIGKAFWGIDCQV